MAMPIIRYERVQPDLDRAVALTARGFGRQSDPQFASFISAFVLNEEMAFCAFADDAPDDQPIAYGVSSSYEYPGGAILHASGVMVDPKYQGLGICPAIITEAIKVTTPRYLTFQTQTIHGYLACSKLVEQLYPSLDGSVIPSELALVGQYIADERTGGTFPVNVGAYGPQPLYAERPQHPLAPAFYELCDYEKGDGLICVGALRGELLTGLV